MSTFESAAEPAPPSAPLSSVSMTSAGIAAWLLAAALTAVGTFTDLTGNDSAGEDNELLVWVVMMIVLAGVTYAVYRFWYGAAAKAAQAPNSALIGGLAALLSFPAFWTGLPSVFAVGAIVLGLRSAGPKAKAGVVLGVLALGVAVSAAIAG